MSLQFFDVNVPLENSASWVDPVDVVSAVTKGANKGAKVKYVTDGRRRDPKAWVSGFVTHTTSGTVRKKAPGLIESMRDWIYSKYQTSTEREVSWHFTLDLDGSVIQQAGPEWLCWHASQVNGYMDGCELVQSSDSLTEVQLNRYVQIMDIWTWHSGVPRIIPWKDGKPYAGMISRCLTSQGSGRNVCAVIGHRNIWHANKTTGKLEPYRGAGDPSDLPFLALAEAGYVKMDIEAGEDLAFWKKAQTEAGLVADGTCGPQTRKVALMEKRQLPGGHLISRPGDAARGVPAWMRKAV